MNKTRRKQIVAICTKLQAIKDEIESVLSEEQEAFENIPESLQETDTGQKSQEAIDSLECAQSDLESMIDALQALE